MLVDPKIRDALLGAVIDNALSCKGAFNLAESLGLTPDKIGSTADLLKIKLIQCQLGLFGSKKGATKTTSATTVSPELSEAILRAARGESLKGKALPCKHAWEIAETHKVTRLHVGQACNALGIKICSCQLGAF